MSIHRLKPSEITGLVEHEPGKHADGGGLYLQVAAPGQASWVYRVTTAGRERWKSLGPASLYTLAEVRDRAHALRRAKHEGRNPLAEITAATVVARATGKSFAEALAEYLKEKSPHWAASNRARELRDHQNIFAQIPDFCALPVKAIDPAAKVAALAKLTTSGQRKAKNWIGAVIKFAETGEAVQRGNAVEVKHHEAMGFAAVPTFYARIAELDTVDSRALRFLILTGARTDEVIGSTAKAPATWREIVLVDGAPTWIVPAERMKARREHRVPLSPQAVALIGERRADDVALFDVSKNAMLTVLKSCDSNGYTVHGFRASFRTWIAKVTTFGDDLGELCLAHDRRSKVEKAYQRSDLLEKRRPLMEAWSAFAARSVVG
jgi:integrase